MSLLPPPQDDDPIIMQFRPVEDQWEINDENIKRMDPKTGQTILHNYCKYINTTPLEVYRYLIETKGCDVNVQDDDNDTPFHYAIRCFDPNDGGNITVLTYLLAQTNINVNTQGYNGNTLLHYACFEINTLTLDIFKLLIERLGAGVNAQDDYKHTPIHIALGLFNSNNGGDIAVLTYLLSQNDVDVSVKDESDNTLLHAACLNINNLPIDVFKLLIETYGLDVNAQNDDKNTPLHHALKHSNPHNGRDINVWAYLINQNNVNLNIKNEEGCNLLHSACTNNLPSYEHSVELDAKCDTVFCQIVAAIAEGCVQEVLNGTTP
jgi:ankyrin repeat protein